MSPDIGKIFDGRPCKQKKYDRSFTGDQVKNVQLESKLCIECIPTYPDNGSAMILLGHELPFVISRGQDGFPYLDQNGLRHEYNMGAQLSDSWIIELEEGVDISMFDGIFSIKESLSWKDLYHYGNMVYLKALRRQITLAKKEYKNNIKILQQVEGEVVFRKEVIDGWHVVIDKGGYYQVWHLISNKYNGIVTSRKIIGMENTFEEIMEVM